jgi:hypothetical protein
MTEREREREIERERGIKTLKRSTETSKETQI